MQSFFELFTRYLQEKAISQELDWNKIQSPSSDKVVPYDSLKKATDNSILNKLAVLKVNGGLGTSMGKLYASIYILHILLKVSIFRYDRR